MGKRVQTRVAEHTHDLLRRRARREQRPIKDLVREAVERYVEGDEAQDPLDQVIGTVDLGGGWSTRKDWRDPLGKRKNATQGG